MEALRIIEWGTKAHRTETYCSSAALTIKRPSEGCSATRRLGSTELVAWISYQLVWVTILLGRSGGWIGSGRFRLCAAFRVPDFSNTRWFELGVARGAAGTGAFARLTGVRQCGEGTVPVDGEEESNPVQIHSWDCKRVMNRGRRLGGGDKEAVLCQSTVGVGRFNFLFMVCVCGGCGVHNIYL